MADRKELQSLIRERILARELPRYGEHRIFGAKGGDQICAACSRAIMRWEVQLDVELTVNPRDPIELSMHRECYDLWRNQSLLLQKGHRAAPDLPAQPAVAAGPERKKG